jgi:hypothetical protein
VEARRADTGAVFDSTTITSSAGEADAESTPR